MKITLTTNELQALKTATNVLSSLTGKFFKSSDWRETGFNTNKIYNGLSENETEVNEAFVIRCIEVATSTLTQLSTIGKMIAAAFDSMFEGLEKTFDDICPTFKFEGNLTVDNKPMYEFILTPNSIRILSDDACRVATSEQMQYAISRIESMMHGIDVDKNAEYKEYLSNYLKILNSFTHFHKSSNPGQKVNIKFTEADISELRNAKQIAVAVEEFPEGESVFVKSSLGTLKVRKETRSWNGCCMR